MKNLNWVIILFLSILAISCSKDDTIEKDAIVKKNVAPSKVALLSPENDELLVSRLPLLKWKEAVDPEGKEVTYEILMGENESNVSIVADNLTVGEFQIVTPLEKGIKYYWKVIAKDAAGESSISDVADFTTEYITPTLVTNNAAFSKRSFSTITSFKGKLWLIGGKDEEDNELSDIWSSDDGENWELQTLDAPFGNRYRHDVIVFNSRMWLYCGAGDGVIKRDFWSTADGINWVEETNESPWNITPFYHSHGTMFVFENKIWRFAGYTGSIEDLLSEERNIWNSTDGKNWTKVSENHGFDSKYGMEVIPFNDQLIGLEGSNFSSSQFTKVWQSNDGINWNMIAENLPFKFGVYTEAIVYDNKLYLTAGSGYNELWYTEDGILWEEAIIDRKYPARHAKSSIIFNDRIYVVGGGTFQDSYNDVWYLN